MKARPERLRAGQQREDRFSRPVLVFISANEAKKLKPASDATT